MKARPVIATATNDMIVMLLFIMVSKREKQANAREGL
jgi:hypothetical protein